jgi:hypothetical protein
MIPWNRPRSPNDQGLSQDHFGSYRKRHLPSPYLPAEEHAKLATSAGATDVTGYSSPTFHFLDTAQVQESGCRRQRSVEDEEDWGNEKWR